MPTRPFPYRRAANQKLELGLGVAIGVAGFAAIAAILFWPWRHPDPVTFTPRPVVAVKRPPAPPPAPPAPVPVVPVTLTAPPSVLAGGVVAVRWTGPDVDGDAIAFVRAGAPPSDVGTTQATHLGPTVKFTAPDDPGAWEIRYVTQGPQGVLARSSIEVLPRTVQLEAPASVTIGAQCTVSWQGTNRPGDYLTIVPPSAYDGFTAAAVPLDTGSSVNLPVPVEPGEAEIRCMTATGRVVGRRSLSITLPITVLYAPDEVVAGSTFEVRWVGPGNPGDAVVVAPSGRTQFAPVATPIAATTIEVKAPAVTGLGELRYVTGPQALILARRPLRIVPVTQDLASP